MSTEFSDIGAGRYTGADFVEIVEGTIEEFEFGSSEWNICLVEVEMILPPSFYFSMKISNTQPPVYAVYIWPKIRSSANSLFIGLDHIEMFFDRGEIKYNQSVTQECGLCGGDIDGTAVTKKGSDKDLHEECYSQVEQYVEEFIELHSPEFVAQTI